jgi:hypothetical protein
VSRLQQHSKSSSASVRHRSLNWLAIVEQLTYARHESATPRFLLRPQVLGQAPWSGKGRSQISGVSSEFEPKNSQCTNCPTIWCVTSHPTATTVSYQQGATCASGCARSTKHQQTPARCHNHASRHTTRCAMLLPSRMLSPLTAQQRCRMCLICSQWVQAAAPVALTPAAALGSQAGQTAACKK